MTQPLYIFLHVSKTAGTTFTEHVRINCRLEEFVPAYEDGRYYDIHERTWRTYPDRDSIVAYLKSLSAEEKAGIKVIFGHQVRGDFATLFGQETRHLTFLRDPIERVVSQFNYDRWRFKRGQLPTEWRRQLCVDEGGFPSFARYAEAFPSNYQVRVLCEEFAGEPCEPVGDAELRRAKAILDSFYFVGTTASFEDDSLYLYGQLGFRRFASRRLAAGSLLEPAELLRECPLTLVDRLRDLHARDYDLYHHALSLNREFRDRRPDYGRVVARMRRRARAYLARERAWRDAGRVLRGGARRLWSFASRTLGPRERRS